MSLVVQNLLQDATKSLSAEQRSDVENQINSKLAKSLGSDWSKLPVSGPRMMVVVLLLNATLLPFGIVPSVIADQALRKGKEYEIDEKFSSLLENVKEKKDEVVESDTFNEMVQYAGKASKSIKETLLNIAESGKEGAKNIFGKSKGFIKNQKSKWKK